MEFLLCDTRSKNMYMHHVPVAEAIAVASSYIWWQRRQIVKEEQVQSTRRIALAIQAIAVNFVKSTERKEYKPRVNIWRKPPISF